MKAKFCLTLIMIIRSCHAALVRESEEGLQSVCTRTRLGLATRLNREFEFPGPWLIADLELYPPGLIEL